MAALEIGKIIIVSTFFCDVVAGAASSAFCGWGYTFRSPENLDRGKNMYVPRHAEHILGVLQGGERLKMFTVSS